MVAIGIYWMLKIFGKIIGCYFFYVIHISLPFKKKLANDSNLKLFSVNLFLWSFMKIKCFWLIKNKDKLKLCFNNLYIIIYNTFIYKNVEVVNLVFYFNV